MRCVHCNEKTWIKWGTLNEKKMNIKGEKKTRIEVCEKCYNMRSSYKKMTKYEIERVLKKETTEFIKERGESEIEDYIHPRTKKYMLSEVEEYGKRRGDKG